MGGNPVESTATTTTSTTTKVCSTKKDCNSDLDTEAICTHEFVCKCGTSYFGDHCEKPCKCTDVDIDATCNDLGACQCVSHFGPECKDACDKEEDCRKTGDE